MPRSAPATCLLILLTTATAAGAPARADGPAATQPAKPAAPTDVMPRLLSATARGDVDGLRACMHAPDDASKKVAGWQEDVARAAGEVRKACVARFGDAANRRIDAVEGHSAEDRAGASQKVEGDVATVWLGDPEINAPIPMRKVDGGWKLDVAAMIRQEAWSADKWEKVTTSAIKRLAKLKGQVERGEVATLESAVGKLQDAASDADTPDRDEGL